MMHCSLNHFMLTSEATPKKVSSERFRDQGSRVGGFRAWRALVPGAVLALTLDSHKISPALASTMATSGTGVLPLVSWTEQNSPSHV